MGEVGASRRVFVGGLRSDVSEEQLRERFVGFGDVIDVEFVKDSDGNPRGFAYLDMVISDHNLAKAQSVYSKSTWKGMKLKVATAKPSYVVRLQEEWKEIELDKVKQAAKDELRKARRAQRARARLLSSNMAPVTDETAKGREGWIIGRYGRALPLITLRKPGSRKMVKTDPKKVFTRIKRFADADDEEIATIMPSKLTWSLRRWRSLALLPCSRRPKRKRMWPWPA